MTDAFFELCDRAGVATLIERGAHEAAASVRFLQMGTDRAPIAVEANPHTFQTLTAKASEHGVETLQVAVGASSGIAELNIPTSDANVEGSEPAASNASLRVHRKWDRKRKAIRTVPAQVTTLDELVEARSTTESLALWVDVEGYAAEVFEGAQGLLSQHRLKVILVEVEADHVCSGGRDQGAVADILRRGGLRPVDRDHQSRMSTVFNVLFAHHSINARPGPLRRRIEAR